MHDLAAARCVWAGGEVKAVPSDGNNLSEELISGFNCEAVTH